MKRYLFLAVCALLGFGAEAQQSVIKDAERAMGNGANFTEVVKIITPAMSNPETRNNPLVYVILGKAGFKQYDYISGRKRIGIESEDSEKDMLEALLVGYDYMVKALTLDSLPDAYGKVKTKYSTDIINTIAKHYNDFDRVAFEFWELHNYDKAYRCWEIYVSLPEDAHFAKLLQNVPTDMIRGERLYQMAMAAWNMKDFEEALNTFMRAKAKGYTKKELYDYAIHIATSLNKNDVATALAQEAMSIYGTKETTMYLSIIVLDCINHKNYEKALAIIDKAIANDPDNAECYVIKGIFFDQNGIPANIRGNSREQYHKAIELDPNNSNALLQLGFSYCMEAFDIHGKTSLDKQVYDKTFSEKIKPLMLKGIGYLEQSYNLNEENANALKILESAYSFLNDDENLIRILKLKSK